MNKETTKEAPYLPGGQGRIQACAFKSSPSDAYVLDIILNADEAASTRSSLGRHSVRKADACKSRVEI